MVVTNPLSDIHLMAKFFSRSVGCLFTPVTVSFAVQKLFGFMQSYLSIFSPNC
jgi:hypothetical protein